MSPRKKIQIYDTTLRDGTQAEDVSLTVDDKVRIALKLDELGVDYIEGGWPGSNPRDSEFFAVMREKKLKHARLVAFGATRKFSGKSDSGSAQVAQSFSEIIQSGAKVVCLFGKTWDLHVHQALKISLKDNLSIITDSIRYLVSQKREVIFDAEHFFDGYKANKKYALECLSAAKKAGASVLVLCDTNGGSLPHEVEKIVREVRKNVRSALGIHCHNDSEVAVANSLAAIQSGAVQVQGTMNGLGERCGNANLVSIIANLELKLGYQAIGQARLKRLREIAHFVDQVLNRTPSKQAAYVGDSAFAHKGGVHVSAVMRNSQTYEHIDPAKVGNGQRILLSDLSGLATIKQKLTALGLNQLAQKIDPQKLLQILKERERDGYQYEDAEASFALLVREAEYGPRDFFTLVEFEVIDKMAREGRRPESQARLKLRVRGEEREAKAKGVGPVHALDQALREALSGFYNELAVVKLADYKVRVLTIGKGTQSVVRVHIDFTDGLSTWSTVGVSENVIEASYRALVDGFDYFLFRTSQKK